MKTIMNMDVEMPEEIITPLNIFEAHCMCHGIKETTEDYVRGFLAGKYGKEISDLFRPEFLYQ